MKEPLTASRLTTLLSCFRKHFYRYELGLMSAEQREFFRLGTAWHKAMECYTAHLPYEDALVAALPASLELTELNAATIAALLAGYYAYWNGQNVIKELYAEVEFRDPIEGSRSFDAAGKLDGLGARFDGRLTVVEYKTTSDDISPDSDYWMRLRANTQLFQYVIAARNRGWNITDVQYDVVRKPSMRPCQIPKLDENGCKIVLDAQGQRVFKKDGTPRESADKEKGYELQSTTETPEQFSERLVADTKARPEFYFARREVPILDQDLEEFKAQRLTLSRFILQCRQAEKKLAKREHAWPRNVNEMVCKFCEFHGFCLQNLTLDLNNLPAGLKIETQNPELSQSNEHTNTTTETTQS